MTPILYEIFSPICYEYRQDLQTNEAISPVSFIKHLEIPAAAVRYSKGKNKLINK